jgi:hypothetical protein
MVEVGPTTITQDRLKAGGRTFTLAAGLGVVGLLFSAVGYAVGGSERPVILADYLVAFAYWLGIAIAASIWNAIFHAAAARWMTVFRRVFETMGAAIPVFILLFVPIALGMPVLFPWVNPSSKMSHEQLELLTHKALWLNVPGFLIRAAVYFAIWVVVNQLLRGWSLRQDQEGGLEPTRRMRRWGSRFSTVRCAFIGMGCPNSSPRFASMALASRMWTSSVSTGLSRKGYPGDGLDGEAYCAIVVRSAFE